ncbi:MAG: hypothetical protein RJB52_1119 [Pseudomonadota bacterium]
MLIDTLLRSGLILVLIYLAWVDLRTFLLPNKVTYPLVALGLFFNTLTPYALCDLQAAWLGALIGYFALYLINRIYRQFRRQDGLGIRFLAWHWIFTINAISSILTWHHWRAALASSP